MAASKSITLPDGRRLAYETYGDEDGAPLVFHHGTPGSAVLGELLSDPAAERGVRVVAPSRPGYGASDPDPGRTVASWADDCAALADRLSLESFAVVGFSGGAPFALHAAARLPDRVTAVGLVGAVVPGSEAGLFGRLSRTPRLLGLVFRASDRVASARGPGSVVDQLTDESVTGETERIVGRDFHAALESGPTGVVRENALLAGDWSLPDPDAPVRAWHGTADENVPIGPVRTAFADAPGVSLTEVDTDHLGSLLAVREALVGLAER